jgi:hypothetical protein
VERITLRNQLLSRKTWNFNRHEPICYTSITHELHRLVNYLLENNIQSTRLDELLEQKERIGKHCNRSQHDGDVHFHRPYR